MLSRGFARDLGSARHRVMVIVRFWRGCVHSCARLPQRGFDPEGPGVGTPCHRYSTITSAPRLNQQTQYRRVAHGRSRSASRSTRCLSSIPHASTTTPAIRIGRKSQRARAGGRRLRQGTTRGRATSPSAEFVKRAWRMPCRSARIFVKVDDHTGDFRGQKGQGPTATLAFLAFLAMRFV